VFDIAIKTSMGNLQCDFWKKSWSQATFLTDLTWRPWHPFHCRPVFAMFPVIVLCL